jgi:hypothetical protein
MTVQQLIEQLEEHDPQAEVLLATQPSWPFENTICDELVTLDHPNTVYIAEAGQVGYLSAEVKDELENNGSWG